MSTMALHPETEILQQQQPACLIVIGHILSHSKGLKSGDAQGVHVGVRRGRGLLDPHVSSSLSTLLGDRLFP